MKRALELKYIPFFATIAVALILYTAVGIVYPNFVSLRVFIDFFRDNAFLGIIAVGMTFVILSGGIDLSVGSMIAFVSILCAVLIGRCGLHPLPAFAIALALGTLSGFVMGLLIVRFDAPPFIVTLAGMFFLRGVANMISLESIPINNAAFKIIMRFGIYLPDRLKIPSAVLIMFAVFAIFIFVAHGTKFGRNVYAIGGSRQSALLMGLPVGKTTVGIYTLSGFLSALGGIAYILNTPAGNCLAGFGVELDAIACVVMGGTLLSGGLGYLAGTFVGVLILAIIKTFLAFSSLSSWWTKIAIGLLLLGFMLLQKAIERTSVRLGRAD